MVTREVLSYRRGRRLGLNVPAVIVAILTSPKWEIPFF